MFLKLLEVSNNNNPDEATVRQETVFSEELYEEELSEELLKFTFEVQPPCVS